MFRLISACFILTFFSFPKTAFAQEGNKEVLVFYKTEGFQHESIPTGKNFISALGDAHNFEVKATDDSNYFLRDHFEKYDLVIFVNTSGNVFDEDEQKAFENYIKKGVNFLGIHAAADTEMYWPWFVELVGGYFDDHPEIQEADIKLNMPDHPTVSHLPEVWTRTDEWYNYKSLNPEMQVLLYLDEDSYKGGTNGEKHPIAWFRQTGHGGVAIYTGLGHTKASYAEPAFQEHVLQSILFALDKTKK